MSTLKNMACGISRAVWAAAFSLAVAFAVAACPTPALAMNSEEALQEFSSYELGRLFVEVDGIDECEFVMHDYSTGEDVYLNVRSQYKDRYEELVGEDAVSLISDEGSAAAVSDESSLVEIEDPGESPWNDLLYLEVSNDQGTLSGRGSAFSVSERVAVTAAHCAYSESGFFSRIQVTSRMENSSMWAGWAYASKAVVPKQWVASVEESLSSGDGSSSRDYEHDFCLLVLDRDVPGVSESGFSYESLTMSDGLSTLFNNAGYAMRDGESVKAWRNEKSGGISLLAEIMELGGNCFFVNIETCEGMSGGPVYRVDDDGGYVVVGINSRFLSSTGKSVPVRITERLQVLVVWAENEGFSNTASSSGGGSVSPGTCGEFVDGALAAAQLQRQDADSSEDADLGALLAAAQEENPDVAAWLSVPGTNVSLPVCWREGDNDFYLDHDAAGGESGLGAAFLDGENSPGLSDPVTVLYGHSCNGADVMLTQLHLFENTQFFEDNGEVLVRLPDRLLTYRVAAACRYNDTRVLSLVDLSDPTQVQDYLDFAVNPWPGEGNARGGVSLDASEDRILQLSTCMVPSVKGARFVVTCVLESEEAVGS